MATTSSRRTPGVGGKIVKNNNRSSLRATPYSRPISSSSPFNPQSDDSENPNWLSGLIYPAKVIANGAGKILSFFGNDYSSSSSSSENDEDDDDDEEVGNDVSFQEDGRVEKVLSPSNKSDNKHAIEQLVIQETYSRKEANELIKLVKSRIVDTDGETTPNVRTAAILEARKWLQENRSSSKKKSGNELDFSNVASPSHISRNEKGSPVDMARSYMQNRPAWASPSSKQVEVGSSSPFGMLQFKDETPRSTRRNSELRKGSFTSGSWNLLEEIRRVRTKASEELLASAPLTKTILPSYSPESNPPHDPLLKKGDAEAVESTHDRPDNALPDAARSTPSRASQDGDASQSAEHQGFQEAAGFTPDVHDKAEQLKKIAAGNGFGCSASGSAPGPETTHEARLSEEGNGNLVDSRQGGYDIFWNKGRDIHMEENLNPQEDPAVDIPADNMINGSQNSSSLKQEEISQDVNQPTEDGATAKVKDTQNERKSRANTRRAKGRGK